MRIFGIDPGSLRTGYGCIDTDGSRCRLVVCGAIAAPARTSFPDKLTVIYDELAALLAFSAIRNNDQVGMLLFSDRDELHLPPRKGRQHVLRLVRDLLAFERQGRRTDVRSALETFMRVNHRRAVVFLISDLLDHGFEQTLTIANKRHDLIVMRVLDPIERAIPSIGFINLEDAETGETIVFPGRGAKARLEYEESSRELHDSNQEICRRAGVDMIDIVNGEDYIRPLMQFFKEREKRR